MSRYEKRYWDPTGARHGIPTYPWRMAPDDLATRRQLADLGLRPGGAPIVAQLMWSRRNRTVVAYLYTIETAKPRREATPAVLASLDRARAARRRCPECQEDRGYIPRAAWGMCTPCAIAADLTGWAA